MDITEINIKGKCFKEVTTMKFFENKDSRAAIVFGENGSGKSTIGQAMKYIIEKKDTDDFEKVELIKNVDGIKDELTESELEIITNNIFVYNEEFILEKVHFQEDGLSTIVMFGDSKEIQEKIDKLKLKIKDIELDISINNKLISNANNSKDIDSLSFVKSELLKNFRSSWGVKKGELLEYKKSADVNEKIIDDLFAVYASLDKKPLSEYINSYENKKLMYDKLKANTRLPFIPQIKLYFEEYSQVKDALEKKIDKISLGEQANRISKILDQWNNVYLNESRNLTISEDAKDCPLCFQSLSEEYKKEIGEILNIILGSEEIEAYKRKLDALTIPKIEINLEKYEVLDDNVLINQVKVALENMKLSRDNILVNIEDKKINVFKEIKLTTEYLEHNKKIKELIQMLNEEVSKYNQKFNEIDNLKKELLEINDLITVIENQSLYDNFMAKREVLKKAEQELINWRIELEELLKELQKSIAELGSVQIACEAINQSLMYIFYDNNRLKLEHTDGKYIVKSKGIDVKLNSLSIGERNAVALSYFFTTIFNGKSDDKKYEEPMLLIIDDPISSFDHQNKIGIFSFLRLVISEIHSKNSESKVLILTHDLEVFNNMEKLYSDIKEKYKTSFSKYRLDKYKLVSFGQIKNDYSYLVQQVYNFADGDNKNIDYIGNIMRKLLESFATFNYRLNISQLSTDDKILEKMEEPYRKYFENSMYRLVLHGESHMEERVQNLLNKDLYEFINEDEKKRTAKDILVFLKMIDKTHLEKHLSINKEDVSSKIIKIEQWQQNILELVTV